VYKTIVTWKKEAATPSRTRAKRREVRKGGIKGKFIFMRTQMKNSTRRKMRNSGRKGRKQTPAERDPKKEGGGEKGGARGLWKKKNVISSRVDRIRLGREQGGMLLETPREKSAETNSNERRSK